MLCLYFDFWKCYILDWITNKAQALSLCFPILSCPVLAGKCAKKSHHLRHTAPHDRPASQTSVTLSTVRTEGVEEAVTREEDWRGWGSEKTKVEQSKQKEDSRKKNGKIGKDDGLLISKLVSHEAETQEIKLRIGVLYMLRPKDIEFDIKRPSPQLKLPGGSG